MSAASPDLEGYLAFASKWGKHVQRLQWRHEWTPLTDRPKYSFLLLLIKEVQLKGGGTQRTDVSYQKHTHYRPHVRRCNCIKEMNK